MLNHPTNKIIAHLQGGVPNLTREAVCALTGVKDRQLDSVLADALELGALLRRRVDGQIVFLLPEAVPENTLCRASIPAPAEALQPTALGARIAAKLDDIPAQAAPVAAALDKLTGTSTSSAATTAPAASKPKRAGRALELPAVDLTRLEITMRPKHTRATGIQHKWAPLFDLLAAKPIEQDKSHGPTLPTIELGPEYHGALQQAARDWQARNPGRAAFAVRKAGGLTLVQRVE